MTPIDFDPAKLNDFEGTQKALILVLNLVEEVKKENDELQKIIQKLRDEISRLKGEQGQPDIKPSKKKGNKKETQIITPQKQSGGSQRNGKREAS